MLTVIMPCYDKKVESARREFESMKIKENLFLEIKKFNRNKKKVNKMKEVDTVLTTTEFIDLVKKIDGAKL